ncbi:Gamma-glutamyltranspeptidase precursor [Streptomyces sp. YIM 130001]|uniref:gamma-glutamyltransferase n=1 Tax=Streptomyces sp. YIM 130001 TaxID=2259644 RepID=UPI000EE55966|nr:gamma-glutamyltransferase [Streptomyces sp. YIM 130001]RII20653.1 Gamma-glutamyltranspeptidase precursor [Streptomyces sp. YIM 130001]
MTASTIQYLGAQGDDPLGGGRVGPKTAVRAGRAVCSSQHPTVTGTMTDVLRSGGNAVDAAIAGSIVQAVVQQDMTNHTGTVTGLFHEAATGRIHELNSMGRIVPGLAAHHRVPGGKGLYSPVGTRGPMSVIPGFMPGMKAMYERFGSKPWGDLVAPAVAAAEDGHIVTSFETLVLAQTVDFFLYTPSGRAHFTPDGHLPQAGDRWSQPALAKTMAALAAEGPDYFITGGWARNFVKRANELQWPITLDHMTVLPAQWREPRTWKHRDHEVVQLSAPDRQAVYCALVLGILRHLDVRSAGHFTDSPEAGYYMGHALRLAHQETGFINDPDLFEDPSEILVDDDYLAFLAAKLRRSRPRTDLTAHVELTRGRNALHAAGSASEQPAGSCELSVVDADGNWVQMMNTLQSGGIAGEVVDGVPMVGSHMVNSLSSPISGWLTGGGGMRAMLSNTLVLRDGKPVVALGSPGNVHCTVPQVLANILEYGMDPIEAEDRPRMLPLTDDYELSVESRVGQEYVDGLARLGVLVNPLPAYDYHMGSYQMSWLDGDVLKGGVGPRREGMAQGI